MDFQKASKIILQNNRIKIYCGLILLCSLLSLPEDYKLDKRNLLNQWFVKLGWFWTNIFTLPIIFITTKSNDKEAVSKTIFRIITCTILWYTSVNLFQYIDDATGFDISGHTFLLMFSNLLITSELKLLESKLAKNRREKEILGAKSAGDQFIFPESKIGKFKISLLVLTLLWDFMLIQTALYYHTIIQKVIAAIWAIGSWYLLHINFYHNLQLESKRLN